MLKNTLRTVKRLVGVATGICFLNFFPACNKQDAVPVQPQPQDTVAPVTEVLQGVVSSVNNKINGYYVALPSNYEVTSKNYPLLLFIPGAGQFGNGSVDLPLLLHDGPIQLVDEKRFPGSFKVNNNVFSFIVFTPQTQTFPTTSDVSDCIAYAREKYRVDSSRIYVSGLSIGSVTACDWAAEMPLQVAALVPLAGTTLDANPGNKYEKMALSNLPVWAFHSADDEVFKVSLTKNFIASLAAYNPSVAPKLTIWSSGGHDAWTKALDPAYKENGLNIYEWMLQYHR